MPLLAGMLLDPPLFALTSMSYSIPKEKNNHKKTRKDVNTCIHNIQSRFSLSYPLSVTQSMILSQPSQERKSEK